MRIDNPPNSISTPVSVANGGTGTTTLSDVLGTTNQVTVSGGTGRVIGGNVTLSLPQNIDTGAQVTFGNFTSGTFTPTLTAVANSTATAYQCQYLRSGSTVVVSGKIDVDPTLTATSTQVGISLPVASNIGAEEDCSGVAFAPGIAGMGAAILGDAANNRAQLQYISSDVTNQSLFFVFFYEII